MIVGICPCGGKAERFGGYAKEMLPISNKEVLLDRTITALNFGGANRIMVISSIEKIAAHAARLGPGYDYRIKRSDNLWESMKDMFGFPADWYLFAMPDTYYPQDVFDKPDMHKMDFNIGWFETDQPKRYGVIKDDKIYDKQALRPGNYQAWGVLCWTKKVIDFWMNNLDKIETHTDAFNLAMKEFNYSLCKMDYYYDMASWNDYERFVTGLEW